jgi:hypothetical protein
MISKLGKDKAFKIIDQYFRKFYDGGIDYVSLIERCKIEWAAGRPAQAINALKRIICLFERNLTKDEFCHLLLDDPSYSLHLLNPFLNDGAIPDDLRDHVCGQFRVRSHAEYIGAVRSQPFTVKAAFIGSTLAHFSDILYGMQLDYQVAQLFHHKNRVYRLYADYIYRTSGAARDSFVLASKRFLTAAWLEPSDGLN